MTQHIDLNSLLHPDWLALATRIFGRIDGRCRPMAALRAATVPGPAQTAAMSDVSTLTEEDRAALLDELADAPFDIADTCLPNPLPPEAKSLPPRLRLALLRLCAALGAVDALTRMTAPTAITVIEGVPTAIFADFAAMFRNSVLPLAQNPGKTGKIRGVRSAADLAPEPAILYPTYVTNSPSQTELLTLDTRILDAVEAARPIIVLLPFGTAPSDLLMACGPTRIVLPVVDPAMLVQYWRSTTLRLTRHLAARIASALPTADRLAALSDVTLLAALRHRNPLVAARAIATGCNQPTGPRLADLPQTPAKTAAITLIAGLDAWRNGTARWDEIPHSLLLYGPAGTGKSHIAQAMASVPGLRFVRASFADWQATGHLGDMLKAMSASFAQARAAAPAVLFVDEIDSAGSRSSEDRNNKGYQRQVINGFLLAIDRLNSAGGVLLVGACNDRPALDPAILRPGRFDWHVEVPLPDHKALLSLLQTRVGDDLGQIEMDALSRRLIGQSMALADSAVRSAKLAARLAGRKVTLVDFDETVPLVTGRAALEWRIAIHEAGHAVVAEALAPGTVTRISLGGTGGATERVMADFEGLEAEITAHLAELMAGRAAERLVLGTVSAGSGGTSQSDLAQATTLAMAMETQLGLGLMGPVWLADTAPRDPRLYPAIRARLEAAEAQAAKILKAHQPTVVAIATALVRERELTGTDLAALLGAPGQVDGGRGEDGDCQDGGLCRAG